MAQAQIGRNLRAGNRELGTNVRNRRLCVIVDCGVVHGREAWHERR